MKAAFVAVVLLSSLALAQTQAPAPQSQKRTTTLVFEATDDILGEKQAPDLTLVVTDSKPGFKSLIKVRESFGDKVMQSVHEL